MTPFNGINHPMVISNDTKSKFRLLLNDKLFVVCWWLVVLLHVADFAFLVAMVCLNYWLLHDHFATYSLLDLLSFDISYQTLNVMNWVFAAVAGFHGIALLRVFRGCVRARRLEFAAVSVFAERSRVFSTGERMEIVRQKVAVMGGLISAAFYVRGKHFDDFFLVQEYLEIASQMYQAKRMSDYVATRWINNLFVGMIFINSMSTPLIHRLVPDTQIPLRRMLEVVMSAFLNFINSVVIPVIIFTKYVQAYVPAKYSFHDDQLFGDVWFPKAMHENEQLFVTSGLDFLSTLWPHISLFNCLLTCQSVLTRSSGPKQTRVVAIAGPKTSFMHKGIEFLNHPTCSRTGSKTQRSNHVHVHKSKARKVLYNILWMSGLVVLGIHIVAQSVPDSTSCMLGSSPWLNGRKSSCVVMNINCYRLGIDGTRSEIDSILSSLNTESMNTFIISHCPRLGLPPSIRRFRQLYGIEIYNSTIEDWPAESAPHAADYVFLQYIYIVFSNLTSLPIGLLQDTFPVQDMYLYGTNLTTLPRSIKDTWVNIMTLLMEYDGFTAIPPVALEMPLVAISLAGSPIRHLEVDVFANKELFWLYLSGCPVTTLPADTTGNLDELMRLPMEFTQLMEVPSFIRKWYLANDETVIHSLFGSPYCNKTVDDDDEEKRYQAKVCAKDLETITGRYPIHVVVPQRPP